MSFKVINGAGSIGGIVASSGHISGVSGRDKILNDQTSVLRLVGLDHSGAIGKLINENEGGIGMDQSGVVGQSGDAGGVWLSNDQGGAVGIRNGQDSVIEAA